MRSVLIGAVDSTVVALRAMIAAGHPPLRVLTLSLARAGRHSDFADLRPLAASAGIPVVEADQVNAPPVLELLRALDLDHVFVVGWSQLVSAELLAIPRRGVIGYHPAPLPELRGRGVIPWTILLRRTWTGSTLFWIDEGMDTGDILGQERIQVGPAETAATLYAKHLQALERLVLEALPGLADGRGPRIAQAHERATFCARRTAADGLIDWSRPAEEVWTLIRAVGDPYPGAFALTRRGRLRVWSADLVPAAPYFGMPGQVQALLPDGALVLCGDGSFVRLGQVQLEGSPRSPSQLALKLHERLDPDLEALWSLARSGGPA